MDPPLISERYVRKPSFCHPHFMVGDMLTSTDAHFAMRASMRLLYWSFVWSGIGVSTRQFSVKSILFN
jgi:hypothetical protein